MEMETEIRGEDLIEALGALARNPELLDRARARFGEPPRGWGVPSASPTRSPTPEPEDLDPNIKAERLREGLLQRLRERYYASVPHYQFQAQVDEEEDRLPRYVRPYKLPPGIKDLKEHARANVQMRWVEQGIWRKEWDGMPMLPGPWKHQMPRPERAQGPPMSDGAARLEERSREASRPYHQFIYQVSLERDRIKDDLTNLTRSLSPDRMDSILLAISRPPLAEDEPPGAREGMPPDINTIAYERVKSTWMSRRIWNPKWGVLPGMSWMHEVVDDDPAANAPGNALWAPSAGGAEKVSVPRTAPETAPLGIFGESGRSVARGLNMSMSIINDIIKDANAAGAAEADLPPKNKAQRAPPAPGSQRRSVRSTRGQDARPAGKRQQRNTRKAPVGEVHSLDTERAALGPIRASRVSKRGRPRAAAEPALPAAPVTSGAPPAAGTLRRSKRLQAVADKRLARGRTAA